MKRQIILLTLTITIILALCSAVSAADEPANDTANATVVDPPLDITKGSWDIAGLDSNNVNVGPNQTIIQFRVRNPDPVNTAHDVNATFAWTSANTYINLAPGETAVKNIGNILPGETKDVFYLVEITRNSGAYLTSRNYQVTIQGSDTPLYTPTGSIYVEKLLSQNRNDITGIFVSPPNPHVGETFNVTVTSTTGSPNYPELALPLVSYDPSLIMPLGMVTTYTDINNIDRTTYNVYIPNPLANAFTTVWTFLVLDAGISDLYPVIYDRSGSSYHYNADFGEAETVYVPAEIGNYVWYDQDADGIQDAGEPGVPNVIVNLYNSIGAKLDTTVTDANGYYYFINIYPGNYFVEFELPAGYNFSPQDQGLDNTIDSDANPLNGRTIVTTLDPGEIDYTWDAGIYNNGSIGDFVWEDQNANGIYEGLGPGVAGVTVNLLDGLGNFITSTITDANGYYLFSGLAPGNYIVEFELPAGYNFSPQDQGADDTLDSDADTSTGRTTTITLTSNESDSTWDAAIYQFATIGDFVWNDLNVNGIQDAGEPGVGSVIVKLYNNLNVLLATTTTDANGYYQFTNLNPGNYFLEFVLPIGFLFSPQNQGADNVDSDADTSTGRTATTTLTSGETDNTWDAGMWQPASVGSFVWNDQNANGIFEGRGTGLPNVQVDLYDGTGTILLDTTFTDANGFYEFTNLVPGTYVLRFALQPGFFFSPQFPVTDPNTTSKADPVTGYTAPLALAAGENNPYIDAAMWQPVSIGDRVWNDLNRNGIQDAGEPGFANVQVELYDLSSNLISTTTTDSNGNYIFENQRPNFYYVKFIKPSGYQFSPQYAGTDPTIDSDAFPVNGETAPREFTSGTVYLDLDAGLMQEQADLSITKTVNPNSVTVGEEVTYTIIVRNNGPDTARNVRVTDILPEGVEYIDYTASVGNYDPSTGIWTIGDLENGQTATLTIKAKAIRTGVFNNVAVVSSDTYDPDMENNRATASLTVREPVKAATVPMQPTGLPVGYLVLAVLMVLAGVLIPKSK